MSAGRKYRRKKNNVKESSRCASFAQLSYADQNLDSVIGKRMAESVIPEEYRPMIFDTAKKLNVSIRDSMIAYLSSTGRLTDDGEETPSDAEYRSMAQYRNDFDRAKEYYDSLINEWLTEKERNNV